MQFCLEPREMDEEAFTENFDVDIQNNFEDYIDASEGKNDRIIPNPAADSFQTLDAAFPLQYSVQSRVTSTTFVEPQHFQIQLLRNSHSNVEPVMELPTRRVFEQLWTEKYRPARISDLVGNDDATLELVRWITDWKNYLHSPGTKNIPENSIVLISGPPGIGKTTLASIAVKNAGFLPVVLNASDERGADALSTQVMHAGNAKTSFTEGRPFFILDEIDGACESGIIKLLASFTSKKPEDSDASVKSEPKPKRAKKQQAFSPRMPIICICNDLYATSIRALRLKSLSIAMKKIHFSDAVKRLEHVCHLEDLPYENKALISLSELYDGDIRGCLNCLQMASSCCKKFSYRHFQSFLTAYKDTNQSIFSLLSQIFYQDSKRKSSFRTFHDSFMQLGEEEKIMRGCFENYQRSSFVDVSLEKTCIIGDWLYFYDLMMTAIHKEQDYALQQFANLIPCLFHYQCSSYNKQVPIKYPKIDYEMQMTHRTCDGIINSLKMSTFFSTKSVLRTEFVSYFVFIIDPSLKITNYSLLKGHEKELIDGIAAKMKSKGIAYTQKKISSSSYKFTLEPPIDKLLIQNMHSKWLHLLDDSKGYHIKQLLSSGICRMEIKNPKIEGKPLNIMKSIFFSSASSDTLTAQPKNEQAVWYRYQEGFSNAVKKTLRIKDILNL